MDKNGALLQDIQNLTNCSKFNFVSIKEEPSEEICSESDLTHFENSEIKFQVNSEDSQQVCSARPLVCICRILVTVLFKCIMYLFFACMCVPLSQGW
jgi:hypothetical protein